MYQQWIKDFVPKQIEFVHIDPPNTSEFKTVQKSIQIYKSDTLKENNKLIAWLQRIINHQELSPEAIAVFTEYLQGAEENERYLRAKEDLLLDDLELAQQERTEEAIKSIEEFYHKLIILGKNASMIMQGNVIDLINEKLQQLHNLLEQIKEYDLQIQNNIDQIATIEKTIENNAGIIEQNKSQIASNNKLIEKTIDEIRKLESFLLETNFFHQLSNEAAIDIEILKSNYEAHRYSKSGMSMIDGLCACTRLAKPDIQDAMINNIVDRLDLQQVITANHMRVQGVTVLKNQNNATEEINKQWITQNESLKVQKTMLEQQRKQTEQLREQLVTQAQGLAKEINSLRPVAEQQTMGADPEATKKSKEIIKSATDKISEIPGSTKESEISETPNKQEQNETVATRPKI